MHTFGTKNDPKWINEASIFSKKCHNTLLSTPKALWHAFNLGLTYGTIQDLELGWNSHYMLLPEGLVIPNFASSSRTLIKLTICSEHKSFLVPGSKNMSVLYEALYKNLPIIIVDSQLHAILLQQFAGDLASFLVLDLPTTHPYTTTHHSVLKAAQCILFAINHTRAFEKWKSFYPNMSFWHPFELNKDPFTTGMKIRNWVLAGIEMSQTKKVLVKTLA